MARKAPLLFNSSKAALKSKLLRFLVSNLKLEGKKLVYNLKAPFDTIVECFENENWRELVRTLRTSAAEYEGFEFDNLFDSIQEHEPTLMIEVLS